MMRRSCPECDSDVVSTTLTGEYRIYECSNKECEWVYVDDTYKMSNPFLLL